MLTTIADGRSSETAEVSSNRLSVQSVSQDESKLAAVNGDAYNINTGTVTLTNATKTPVLFVKNTGDVDLVIDTVFYILGASTAGTGNAYIELVRNPTAGTIVSGAVNVDMNVNRNFGSNNTISADAYKGATGITMTGGTDALGSITVANTTIAVAAGAIILKKGSTVGVNVTAPTGNTSMPVQVALSIYEKQL